jgi:hypothetical protein
MDLDEQRKYCNEAAKDPEELGRVLFVMNYIMHGMDDRLKKVEEAVLGGEKNL